MSQSINSEDKMFHLKLSAEDIGGAKLAILPGDPGRVHKIAACTGNEVVALASNREFVSALTTIAKQPIVVCSTGIGGPSVSIAVEELAQLGVRYFLRVGTTGALVPSVNIGDVVITTAAVRLDGASLHFAPLCFPAVSDFHCTKALVDAAVELGLHYHTGVTASSDTFYPGQERYDTFSGRVVKQFQGSLAEWQAMGVLNYEMESATLFTMCATMGLKAGCVAGVLVNRSASESPKEEAHVLAEKNSIATVIRAASLLLTC